MMVGYEPAGKAYKRLDGYVICNGSPRLTALDSTGFGDKDHNYSLWSIDDTGTAMTLEFIKPSSGK